MTDQTKPGEKLVADVLSDSLEIVLCKVANAVTKMSEELPQSSGGLKIGHHHLLRFLSTAGPVSQQEISEASNVDRSTMTDWIDELEKKGFVERRKNPTDRRAYAVHITDKGTKALKQSVIAVDQFRQRAFGALSSGERQALLDLLLRLANSGNLPRAC
jgi:DNA-binding MarR family transcriptional regulator